jgi:hypothetical protein
LKYISAQAIEIEYFMQRIPIENKENDHHAVFVACPVGFYGNNCVERCNTNCGLPGVCNKTSGQCEGGCQPGWRGILCDTSKCRIMLCKYNRI